MKKKTKKTQHLLPDDYADPTVWRGKLDISNISWYCSFGHRVYEIRISSEAVREQGHCQGCGAVVDSIRLQIVVSSQIKLDKRFPTFDAATAYARDELYLP